jgi:hypothetical protein
MAVGDLILHVFWEHFWQGDGLRLLENPPSTKKAKSPPPGKLRPWGGLLDFFHSQPFPTPYSP